MTLDELRAINRYAESTKSLSYLPQVKYNALFIYVFLYVSKFFETFLYNSYYQVHERQTARMRTRSEWFLTPVGEILAATDSDPTAMHVLRGSNRSSSGNIGMLYGVMMIHYFIVSHIL